MPAAGSLSMCNITVSDSSAAAGVVSNPGANSLCPTVPGVYALQSGQSPAGATQRTEVHCNTLRYFIFFNYLYLLNCVRGKHLSVTYYIKKVY
jgi:hypothetical protein